MSFGVNEVLLASVLGSVVFSIFACQPLVIVGVTGTTCVKSCNLELTLIRPYHCLQLHRLRYHHAERHQLLCVHVLDRTVSHPSFAFAHAELTCEDGLC